MPSIQNRWSIGSHPYSHPCSSNPRIGYVNKKYKICELRIYQNESIIPNFTGWQSGYRGFSCSFQDKDRFIEYIKNQEQHHTKKTFREELIDLLNEHGIAFDEK